LQLTREDCFVSFIARTLACGLVLHPALPRCCRSGSVHLFPLIDSDHDLAHLAAAVRTDDDALGHDVDEPRRARVADAERALQEARGAALALEDHAHGFVEHLVLFARALAAAFGGGARLAARDL